jgi:hypothetical protein
MYLPLTGFSRISHRCSDGQNLLHCGTEKTDSVAVSAVSSVTAGLVGSLTECLILVATDVKWQALPEHVKQWQLNYKLFIHVTHKTYLFSIKGPNDQGPIFLQENDNSLVNGSFEKSALIVFFTLKAS